MSVARFPIPPSAPTPDPPARSRKAKRAARCVELQTAREAAGLSIEDLARRMILLCPLREGCSVLGEYDERVFLPSQMRSLEYMERVSQAAYDRTVTWFNTPQAQRANMSKPRLVPYLRDYERALAAIALGPASLTINELRAIHARRVAEEAERRSEAKFARLRAESNAQAEAIAAMIWNCADDLDFLDIALHTEFKAAEEKGDWYLNRTARFALGYLAAELHNTFPHKPTMEPGAAA
ncbi:MAG: hypothetical protein QM677_02540 [Microbacterium sp.]